MARSPSSDFRARAKLEADRYGPDPWIFVRELLQNARDAGATRVRFVIEEFDVGGPQGRTHLRCRDDGEGMSFDHARRYLFSLYASSKEGDRNQVGRFGVGFWSILRFEPSRILIRSRPRSEATGWEISLDGELEQATRRDVEMGPGTEIVLRRDGADGQQFRRVFDAAHQNGRFLCQRDAPNRALEVDVNAKRINEEFGLPAPSATFDRGDVRGVVALGKAPRVELFSRGLRVRSAACLDDLLSTAHTAHSRVRFPELPGSLAPQALLEADNLELLLSRSDARDDRALRRLVNLANRELRLLVERQLDRIRPPGVFEMIASLWRKVVGESTLRRALVSAAVGGSLALVVARLLWPAPQSGTSVDPASPAVLQAPMATVAASGPDHYGDLASRYQGPHVSELDPSRAEPVALHYEPVSSRPYLTALVVEDVAGGASASAGPTRTAYFGQECDSLNCLNIELEVRADAGMLRVPVPTGHRLDVTQTTLGGHDVPVLVSTAGEPFISLEQPFEGTLRYTTSPGSPPRASQHQTPPALPDDLRRQARRLRRLPVEKRVALALDLVRARVRYETSSGTSSRHHAAIESGQGFIERALEIGAGDCDVQNGLLVALLHTADVPARLAVGYVGNGEGSVSPWLHAWVEYREDDGPWRIADATYRSGVTAGSPRISVPAPTGEGIESSERLAAAAPAELDPETDGNEEEPASALVAPFDRTGSSQAKGVGVGRPLALPRWWGFAGSAFGLLLLVLGLLALRRRTRRTLSLDERGNLAALLQGALAQPGAFRQLPALLHRRLIPLRGGGATSLAKVRVLAGEGRLYAATTPSPLVLRAARRGVAVLDGETPEGRAVASSLGATDLDRWTDLLARTREFSILGAVNEYLKAHDLGWQVRAAKQVGERVAALDLRALRVARRDRQRVVLVDADDPWLAEARRLYRKRPQAAMFALLDHLFDHLDVEPQRRARLLAASARAAILEAGQ